MNCYGHCVTQGVLGAFRDAPQARYIIRAQTCTKAMTVGLPRVEPFGHERFACANRPCRIVFVCGAYSDVYDKLRAGVSAWDP